MTWEVILAILAGFLVAVYTWPRHRSRSPAPVSLEDIAEFLSVGGHLSITEWVHLDVGTRKAIVELSKALRADLALTQASLQASPAARSRLERLFVPEDARAQSLMESALGAVLERTRQRVAQETGPKVPHKPEIQPL